MRKLRWLVVLSVFGAQGAWAQAPGRGAAAPKATVDRSQLAILRGFYAESAFGLGAMLGTANGDDLGGGAHLTLSLGRDLSKSVAVEAIGGAGFVQAGGDTDPIRALTTSYIGGALRLNPRFGTRWFGNARLGAAWMESTNTLEASEAGMGALLNLGVEYVVHVRHFSAGLNLLVLAPLEPQRLYVGLAPSLKYTF